MQLPCLLGSQDLPTHLGPLVHPEYTPAKKIMREATRTPEATPGQPPRWVRSSLAEAVLK
jgi:hypothetical protein